MTSPGFWIALSLAIGFGAGLLAHDMLGACDVGPCFKGVGW